MRNLPFPLSLLSKRATSNSTMPSNAYYPVPGDEKSSMSSDDDSITGRPPQKSWWRLSGPLIPWVLTLFFASTTIFLGVVMDSKEAAEKRIGSFAHGFATDFVSVKPIIEAVETTFNGGPAFHDDGQIYVPNPSPKRYVGNPAEFPEIDWNWDNLTWGRYFLITKEEASAHWGEADLEKYWDHQQGGYVTGLDLFHTLHCVNQVRKALDPEHYGGHHHKRANDDTHMNHCLEQIRQYIMCSGDMTPIPTIYYPGLGRNYVMSDVPHTCRNFEALQAWMVDRYEGESRVKPVFDN